MGCGLWVTTKPQVVHSVEFRSLWGGSAIYDDYDVVEQSQVGPKHTTTKRPANLRFWGRWQVDKGSVAGTSDAKLGSGCTSKR